MSTKLHNKSCLAINTKFPFSREVSLMTKLKESYYTVNLSGQLPPIINAKSGIFNIPGRPCQWGGHDVHGVMNKMTASYYVDYHYKMPTWQLQDHVESVAGYRGEYVQAPTSMSRQKTHKIMPLLGYKLRTCATAHGLGLY